MTTFSPAPHCECGHCDSTGRKGGLEILLPVEAWEVAGDGDLTRLAVAPGHDVHYRDGKHWIEDRGSWLAVSAQ